MAHDNPHGFRPLGNVSDLLVVYRPIESASVLRIHDAVGRGSTAGRVDRLAASSLVVGVCIGGLLPEGTAQTHGYVTGNPTGTVFAQIIIDPRARFQVQVENGGTNVQLVDIGYGFDVHVPAAPTGDYSNMELNDVVEPAGGQFILQELVEGPLPGGGVHPTYAAANAEAVVTFNLNELASMNI